MRIKIDSEEKLIEVATEALHILSNLRKFTRLWEQEYGRDLRDRKKYWEGKADELIERLKVPEHTTIREIQIEITNKD